MPQHVGLLTDFGTRAGYVASLKGSILSVCDSCCIVDLSHDIPPQDVQEAAVFLDDCAAYFPTGFIFLAVVDPGVGTRRRMLGLRTRSLRQVFIAPDNGILNLVMEAQGVEMLVSLENKRYWRASPSPTFHGRDIMGPVAGHVAMGVDIQDLGSTIDPATTARLASIQPTRVTTDGKIVAILLHSDQFGNLVTSARKEHLDAAGVSLDDLLEVRFEKGGDVGDTTIRVPYNRTYADAREGDLLCLLNSENRFEVAANRGSAAAKVGIPTKGIPITIAKVTDHATP